MDSFVMLASCTSDETSIACSGLIPNGIPGGVALIIHYVYLIIQVAVPVVLILFGMIGFFKALTSQKEDEIRASQNSFFKKLIIAVVVFLVFSLVKLVFGIVSNGSKDSGTIWSCVEQLLNGNCGEESSSSSNISVPGNAGTSAIEQSQNAQNDVINSDAYKNRYVGDN